MSEELRDRILISLSPSSSGFVSPAALTLRFKEATETVLAQKLRELQDEKLLKFVQESPEAGPMYKPTAEGLQAGEALRRNAGLRIDPLMRQRDFKVESLILALVMSWQVENKRHTGLAGALVRSLDELDIYLCLYSRAELQSACENLVSAGLVRWQGRDGAHNGVEATIRGIKAYDSVREELGLSEDDSLLDPPGRTCVFISYDSTECELALHVQAILTARLPAAVVVFIAERDIPPGADPQEVMLKQMLLRAGALVALCSKRSRSSPWLWWESAAVWARGKLVVPLFIDISAKDFGGPMTLVRQGRGIRDVQGFAVVFRSVIEAVAPGRAFEPVREDEHEKLRRLVDQLDAARR